MRQMCAIWELSPLLFCPYPNSSALSSTSAQHTVIESQTHHSLLVAAVLPLDLPGLHTPQTSQVV